MTRVSARNSRDVRERHNTLAALVEAGVPRKYVARILGYANPQAVAYVAQAIGANSAVIYHRERPKYIAQRLGPRPCKSCLAELPAGHKMPRCEACDRAHHRYGDCACGYAIRLKEPKCARCGVE